MQFKRKDLMIGQIQGKFNDDSWETPSRAPDDDNRPLSGKLPYNEQGKPNDNRPIDQFEEKLKIHLMVKNHRMIEIDQFLEN